MTPPIWKEGALTGIYIGPDILSSQETSAGIYGYLKDNEIFHINADGGFIGGWTFNEAGLQSSNGVVNILAEGSIFAKNPNSTTEYWGIYADGHATFANGNVKFMPDGSAEFAGYIESASGNIGGWRIAPTQLNNGRIILDSSEGLIGVYAGLLKMHPTTNTITVSKTPIGGGVVMYYTSSADFGLVGYSTTGRIFQLGSTNFIAGWNFNHQAIWTGSESPYLAQGSFATNSGELTLAPNGIRSTKWYMDADGTAQFVGGKVQFNENNAEMFGWKMNSGRFSAPHAALVSDSYNNGLYVSSADLSEIASTSLRNTIQNFGGIYIWSDAASSMLCAYDKSGNLGFALRTNGYHSIGNWYFNHESIYTGSNVLDKSGFTSSPGSLILSPDGLYGYNWRLLADGSGSLAGGKIYWESNGALHFSKSVSLSWDNISGALGSRFTHIDANGIYTGTISANQITALSIDVSMITNVDSILSNGNYWGLNKDGSGYLANKNIQWKSDGSGSLAGGKISWTKDGNLTITGEFNGLIGVFKGCVYSPYLTFGGNAAFALLTKDGANLCVKSYFQQGIVLPSDLENEGLECEVLMGYDGQATIRVTNNMLIYYLNKPFSSVSLHGLYNKIRLKAFRLDGMNSVCWYIVNTQDFEYKDNILQSKTWS